MTILTHLHNKIYETLLSNVVFEENFAGNLDN